MTVNGESGFRRDRIGFGIALMLIGTGVFVSMDALVKYLTLEGYPTIQILFFRSLFAFVPVAIFIAYNGGVSSLKTKRPFGHVLRALIGLSAMGVIFYSFKTLPISDVVAIMFAAPIFMTMLSVPMLKEKVGIRRWSAVVVGFIGVLIIVEPGASGIDVAVLIVVFGTVLYSLAMIMVRILSATEPSATIVFYFTVAGTLVMTALLPFGWQDPVGSDWLMLIGVGLVGGTAQLIMTYAIRMAPISVLAPFEYSAMLWALGFDVVLFSLLPETNTLIGAGVVAATGLYIVHRETQLGRRQGTPARYARTRVASADRASTDDTPS